MVISMSFSEFASTFFERPLRRDRLILWCGMVFSMILISDLHVHRWFWSFFSARSASELSQRHLRLQDFFASCWPNHVSTQDQGTNSFYQERHFERTKRTTSFKTFSKQIFRNMFLNKQQLNFKKQQLIFEHTGLTTIETQNVCVLCAHTIMFGLPNGSMLDHDKTPQLIFFLS